MSRTAHSFDPSFTGKAEPRRQRADRIEAQIQAENWEGGLFRTEQRFDPKIVFFNPAVRLEGNGRPRHLFARESHWNEHWSFAHNKIVRFTIDGSTLRDYHQIEYDKVSPNESWEDPRVIVAAGKTFLSVANWIPGTKPINVNQKIALLDDKDRVVEQWSPIFGKNGKNPHWNSGNEKNWAWFDHGGRLHFIYITKPHIVVATDGPSVVARYETDFSTHWKWGDLRGGTNPILIGDEYLAFFHSSIPWKTVPRYGERRRYFTGAYTFEARAPFRVTRMAMKPFLTGSDQDPTIPGSPAVVFPCGLVQEPSGMLYMTYGINDCAAGWVRMSVDSVMERMSRC